jgi:hypothetical protein
VTDRRIRLPDGLDPDEERLVLASLERYFRRETPRPAAWALAGRMDATGHGSLQARRLMHAPWSAPTRWAFARRGTMALSGRGDAR